MYNKFLNGCFDDNCVLGWYRYFLNDNWQYQSSVIFVALLNLLKHNPDWQEASNIAESLALSIIDNLGKDYSKATLHEICNCVEQNLIKVKDQKGNLDIDATPAIINLIRMYINNKDARTKRPDFREAFPSVTNIDFYTFMDEMDNNLESNFLDWLKDYILKKIIYCHHQVALKKYLQTGIATQKFIYENGMIRFLNGSEATHTSPRINTLFDFLFDLELVDMNGITTEGNSLLNKLEEIEAC